MAALDGIRVVDFSRYLSGPTLTMLLADLGADVIKVEPLPAGDPARQAGPFDGTESAYYLASNRNKRSLAVDLKRAEGRQLCLALSERADVLVQNFKPGVIEAMGLGYAELRARNPRLVYCSLSGFGQRPPGAELPGFDQTAQAMSGLMSVTGTPQTGPLRVGIAVVDSVTVVFGAVGILAALIERERTGTGQAVETSLMEAALALMSYQAQKYLSLGEVAGQDGNDHPLMFPQGTFATGRGAVTLACGNQRMWRRLCEVLGMTDLADDPRFTDNAARMRNRVELRRHIEAALAGAAAEEWIPRINAAGIPCSPVLDVAQALNHPITAALRMVEETEHPALGPIRLLGQAVKLERGRQGWLRRPPPLLGEHTVEVCRELGYGDPQIQALLDAGAIAAPAPLARRML